MIIDTFRDGGMEPVVPSRASKSMAEWLADAANAETLARGIVSGFFVPMAYKPDGNREQGREVAIANATGAILLGASIGLDPLTALQQIYVIHGRPGMYARAKAALALAAGHEIWEEEYSAERAVVCGRRKGSEQIIRIVITMADADLAGWTKANSNYAKTPADMLAARATSRVVDRICPDLLMGLASVEELHDDQASAPVAVEVVEVATVRSTAAAVLAAAAPAAVESVEQYPPTATCPVVDSAPEPVPGLAPGTWREINARFAELRVQGPGQTASRLAVIGYIVGREVSRGSQLSEDEGRLILDTLSGDGGRAVVDAVLNPAVDTPVGESEYIDVEPADDPWAMDGAETAGS